MKTKKDNEESQLESLPKEIHKKILLSLDPKSLKSMFRLNIKFSSYNTPTFWKEKTRHDYNVDVKAEKAKERYFKKYDSAVVDNPISNILASIMHEDFDALEKGLSKSKGIIYQNVRYNTSRDSINVSIFTWTVIYNRANSLKYLYDFMCRNKCRPDDEEFIEAFKWGVALGSVMSVKLLWSWADDKLKEKFLINKPDELFCYAIIGGYSGFDFLHVRYLRPFNQFRAINQLEILKLLHSWLGKNNFNQMMKQYGKRLFEGVVEREFYEGLLYLFDASSLIPIIEDCLNDISILKYRPRLKYKSAFQDSRIVISSIASVRNIKFLKVIKMLVTPTQYQKILSYKSYSAFRIACFGTNLKKIKFLWNEVDKQKREEMLYHDSIDMSAFEHASMSDNKNILKQLWCWASLEMKAIWIKYDGYTALKLAVRYSKLDNAYIILTWIKSLDMMTYIVNLAVENKFEIFKKACETGKAEVFDLVSNLFSYQQKDLLVLTKTNNKYLLSECFIEAAKSECTIILEKLWTYTIEYKDVQLNMLKARDFYSNHNTYGAFVEAADNNKVESLKLLWQLADTKIKIKMIKAQNYRAFKLACANGHVDAAKLIYKWSKKLEIEFFLLRQKHDDGFCMAVRYGYKELVKWYLSKVEKKDYYHLFQSVEVLWFRLGEFGMNDDEPKDDTKNLWAWANVEKTGSLKNRDVSNYLSEKLMSAFQDDKTVTQGSSLKNR